jgi:hypothetical protein
MAFCRSLFVICFSGCLPVFGATYRFCDRFFFGAALLQSMLSAIVVCRRHCRPPIICFAGSFRYCSPLLACQPLSQRSWCLFFRLSPVLFFISLSINLDSCHCRCGFVECLFAALNIFVFRESCLPSIHSCDRICLIGIQIVRCNISLSSWLFVSPVHSGPSFFPSLR